MTVSVLVLCALCLTGLNVLLSMLIACIIGGVAGGIPLISAPEGTQTVMQLLTSGFASNATTFARVYPARHVRDLHFHDRLAEILSKARACSAAISWRSSVLTLVARPSQNLIPVQYRLYPDSCAAAARCDEPDEARSPLGRVHWRSGHGAVYHHPFGFGLIFQRVIADNLTENGMTVTVHDVTAANWPIGIAMLLGLLFAVFVLYRKPREYRDIEADTSASAEISEKPEYRHYVMLGAASRCRRRAGHQPGSRAVRAVRLVVVIVFRAIPWHEIDAQIEGGIRLMGQIAIIMLVAGGYASVIKATGGIDALVNAGISAIGGSKLFAAVVITLIGLLVTMGIGTSFGTVPVLAVLFVPMCSTLGFPSRRLSC